MAGFTIRGVVGRIDWEYYTAAAINGYRIGCANEHKWTLHGTCVMSDAFKLSQRPLFFVAPTNKGEWRWPILDLSLVEGQITARLGKPV